MRILLLEVVRLGQLYIFVMVLNGICFAVSAEGLILRPGTGFLGLCSFQIENWRDKVSVFKKFVMFICVRISGPSE